MTDTKGPSDNRASQLLNLKLSLILDWAHPCFPKRASKNINVLLFGTHLGQGLWFHGLGARDPQMAVLRQLKHPKLNLSQNNDSRNTALGGCLVKISTFGHLRGQRPMVWIPRPQTMAWDHYGLYPVDQFTILIVLRRYLTNVHHML